MNALKGFKTIAGLALFMVALQLLNVATGYSLMAFGLIPRTVQGLFGILSSPFLHASFAHLIEGLYLASEIAGLDWKLDDVVVAPVGELPDGVRTQQRGLEPGE